MVCGCGAKAFLRSRQCSLTVITWTSWLTEAFAACRTSSKEERVKEYVATQSLPDLTPDEVDAITEAGSKIHHRAFVSLQCVLVAHKLY